MDITPWLMSASDPAPFVEDVFATSLYTGTGVAQAITSGIDLSGAASGPLMQGGMVWVKSRSNPLGHRLVDSFRTGGGGGSQYLDTSSTLGQSNTNVVLLPAAGASTSQFSVTTDASANTSGATYAAWTFRRAAKFFDVVTYSGNSTARTIAHNLGVEPGLIIIKRTDGVSNWQVYHRSLGGTQYLVLNATSAVQAASTVWNNTAPTDRVFTLGTDSSVNSTGQTFVAYLFAHDPSADGIVQCGTVTTDSSANATATLGWEPGWMLLKSSSSGAAGWGVSDETRGWTADQGYASLTPNASTAEGIGNATLRRTATGYTINGSTANTTFVYCAIRRGPMRTPTTGTQVLTVAAGTAAASDIPLSNPATSRPDMVIWRPNRTTSSSTYVVDNLRGFTATSPYLWTNSSQAEVTPTASPPYAYRNAGQPTLTLSHAGSSVQFGYNTFSRAPGFFDILTYTGDSFNGFRAIQHNLGRAPSMMWIKPRNANNWVIYHSGLGNNQWIGMDSNAATSASNFWGGAFSDPASQEIRVYYPTTTLNTSGVAYVAYLWGDIPGVSKAGTYVSNSVGTSVTTGFTPRLIWIKCTSSNNWAWFDSARGLGTLDPQLSLNSLAVETNSGGGTLINAINVTATGFTAVATTGDTNVGTTGARTFLYYAVA